MSKIRNLHLDRLAMVYVRQSSPQQVLENRESRERQYALAQFAQRFGWPAERVVVIDEDQGQSGKTADQRSGFQRLMTEVSLNHVGMVLGLELSRLSRSNKDWHQLIDVCGIFNALLCDEDGVYFRRFERGTFALLRPFSFSTNINLRAMQPLPLSDCITGRPPTKSYRLRNQGRIVVRHHVATLPVTNSLSVASSPLR